MGSKSSATIWCNYFINMNLRVGPVGSSVYAPCCVCMCVCFQTQLMYKWVQPKICSETVKGAVKLPASGKKQTCPPCNPGFFFTNSSTCEPCDQSSYSNGTGVEFTNSLCKLTCTTHRLTFILMHQLLFKSVRTETEFSTENASDDDYLKTSICRLHQVSCWNRTSAGF